VNREINAAEANRRLYAEIAPEYDRDLDEHRATVTRDVEEVLAVARRRDRVLDACGGSGNVSLVLLNRRIDSVLVDVSPDFLRIYERKASELGHHPEFHESTIESFLQTDVRNWDIIFFAAALHHLEDYGSVLRLAAQRLAPSGVLATFSDPIEVGRIGRFLRRMDYYLHVVFHKPLILPSTIRRKLRRSVLARRQLQSVDYGRLAERHAVTGIDDVRLVDDLRRYGLRIVKHRREINANMAVTRLLFRLLHQPANFAVIAIRPPEE
jgi:ubiquinone/menaquinone biosynthesis C-methylase UbiE